jgi:hypothetical protein
MHKYNLSDRLSLKWMTLSITYDSSYLHYYYNNAIPRITCLTFPTLIRRGMRESKHHSELFKIFSSKHFGEDVHNLLIWGTMSQVNSFCLYMILNQVILCFDVLSSIMEHGILQVLS